MSIQINQLSKGQHESIIEGVILQQAFEQEPVSMTMLDGTVKTFTVVSMMNRARMTRKNVKKLNPDSEAYVVALSALSVYNVYIAEFKAQTISNPEWCDAVVRGIANRDERLQLVLHYNAEAEYEALADLPNA